jgi:two-component system, chemotaxis family, response regulator PixH
MATVLIVEDSMTDLETASRYLQNAGFNVMVAKSGPEAEQKVAQTIPDVIVLDIILPGQSGFELCREFKKNPLTQRVPIVLCSTKNSSVDQMWGRELGANAHLSKPVSESELIRTVRQFL